MKYLIAILAISLVGCASVTLPPGKESQKSFTQELDKPYGEVFRKVVRQMNECIGSEVVKILPEFDPVAKTAHIELQERGFTGTEIILNIDMSPVSDIRTKVTTVTEKPRFSYGMHLMIAKWAAGSKDCS